MNRAANGVSAMAAGLFFIAVRHFARVELAYEWTAEAESKDGLPFQMLSAVMQDTIQTRI